MSKIFIAIINEDYKAAIPLIEKAKCFARNERVYLLIGLNFWYVFNNQIKTSEMFNSREMFRKNVKWKRAYGTIIIVSCICNTIIVFFIT